MSHSALLALAASALLPLTATAQADSSKDGGFGIYAETRLVSRYIWRGYDDAQKTSAVQPYVELSTPLGFTAYAWASSGLDRHHDVDEWNVSLTWTHAIGDWEVGLGYLHYILPGTATEPGPDPADPFRLGSSAEVSVSLARTWESGNATLTYSRGNRAMKGNSLNLKIEQDYAWADDAWAFQPYVQADYLDEYGATAGFENRFSLIELGAPLLRRVGPVKLLAGVHVAFVPSPYVRAANAAAGANDNQIIPWFTFGVVYEP